MKPYQFWVLTVGAGLTLLLALLNMSMFQANLSALGEVNERAKYIQQSTELQGLYRQMVQALGELALSKNDESLRELLAGEGLTINAPAPSIPGAATP